MPLARLGGGWRDRQNRHVGTVITTGGAIGVETVPLARLGGGWREAG